MNREQLYNRFIQGFGTLIASPETGEDEDKTLRNILVLLTWLRDSKREEMQSQPVQQPTQSPVTGGNY